MKILSLLKSDDPKFKGHLWFFLLSYFVVQFNYPLVRASSITMFFEEFGAKSSPIAWVWTVLVLTITILVSNKLQSRWSVQKVFFGISAFSTLIFAISTAGFVLSWKFFTYISFIWKEICIVLQIHLLLAFANNFFKKADFKYIIGPVGAIGSLGGMIGGIVTSYLAKNIGTVNVSWFSLIFVFLPAVFFLKTDSFKNTDAKKDSPLETLNQPGIKNYVLLIALIVMITQFIINIADFKFNLVFESTIPESAARTAYLGSVYTWTNFIGLILQFAVLPLLLPRISLKSLHLFIPVSYLVFTAGLILGGENILFVIGGFYIYLKASDYSLFSGGKELLYQPLQPDQKYGAKYLTDMLVYRASKALIAVVLIYLQSSYILNMMMIVFLLLWLILIIRLFKLHSKIFN